MLEKPTGRANPPKTGTLKVKSVQQIIAQAGGIPAVQENYLSIENPPFMRLVVEIVDGPFPNGSYHISVAHYTTLNGDAMRDPEILFHVLPSCGGEWRWDPIFIQIDFLGSFAQVGDVSSAGEWTATVPKRADDIRNFAQMWATNIAEQGFLEAAKA